MGNSSVTGRMPWRAQNSSMVATVPAAREGDPPTERCARSKGNTGMAMGAGATPTMCRCPLGPSALRYCNQSRSTATVERMKSKETGQSGMTYDAKQELGRVKMTIGKPPAMVEQLKYTLSGAGGNKGKLQLDWENVAASVNF